MFPEPTWLLLIFVVLTSGLAIGAIAALRRPDKELLLARKEWARSIRITGSLLGFRVICLISNARAWADVDFASLSLQAVIFGNLSFVLAYEIGRWRATWDGDSGAAMQQDRGR